MRIIDNSGGFWTDLIVRRKNPNLLISRKIVPSKTFRLLMAEEAISSIRGSRKHAFAPYMVNGQLEFHRFSDGTYDRGILRRTSPDGEVWVPLSETTLKHRKHKGIQRDRKYALRETDRHIYYGLKILRVGHTQIEIGWEGLDAEIASLQDSGFESYGPIFGKETSKAMVIPPRRFRGFQPQFIRVFLNTVDALNRMFK